MYVYFDYLQFSRAQAASVNCTINTLDWPDLEDEQALQEFADSAAEIEDKVGVVCGCAWWWCAFGRACVRVCVCVCR